MKTYIKPEIKIHNVVVEQLLASESGGQGGERGNEWLAKRHDRNDSFWINEVDEADESDFDDDDSWE